MIHEKSISTEQSRPERMRGDKPAESHSWSDDVKNPFEILKKIPSVRGWTADENGPSINQLGRRSGNS